MNKRIITISREFGSGGRTIGKLLAEELDFKYYDSEIIVKVAEKSGLNQDFIDGRQDSKTFSNFFSIGLLARDFQGMSADDYIWEAQTKVIEEIGKSDEKVVIVGRASDYILRNRKDALHILIYSDIENRKKRIIEKYGETEEHIDKRIKTKDKRRKVYYEFYTNRKWGDVHNYTLALNSGEIGIDNCVEIIKKVLDI